MRHPDREHGRGGWIGMATPQANPTVEAEMRLLMPADVLCLTTRLTSDAPESRQRLIDYIEQADGALAGFDTLRLDAIGFACTGSSYLVGPLRERALSERAAAARGCPVVTAAQAIVAALRSLGMRRIALLAPYPAPLVAASLSYWQAVGLEVVATARIDIASTDTRDIYALGTADAVAGLERLDHHRAEAIVLTGTGMPTLGAITQCAAAVGKPILSSNYCLAWEVLRRAGYPVASVIPPLAVWPGGIAGPVSTGARFS